MKKNWFVALIIACCMIACAPPAEGAFNIDKVAIEKTLGEMDRGDLVSLKTDLEKLGCLVDSGDDFQEPLSEAFIALNIKFSIPADDVGSIDYSQADFRDDIKFIIRAIIDIMEMFL